MAWLVQWLQVYGAVNDNWPTVEPYFNETGSNGPSVLPMDQQRELADLAVKTVKTLGFTLVGVHQGCGAVYCCGVNYAAYRSKGRGTTLRPASMAELACHSVSFGRPSNQQQPAVPILCPHPGP